MRPTRPCLPSSSGDTHLNYLSSLGDTLSLRFERTGDLNALAESVAAGRTAVAGTWPSHPDPQVALELDWERTGTLATLSESVGVAREAVTATTPADHPDPMTRLATLADLLLFRSRDGREPTALAEALQLARQVA
jgi:hypothetical protein